MRVTEIRAETSRAIATLFADPIETKGQASRWSVPALKGGDILAKESNGKLISAHANDEGLRSVFLLI